MVEPDKQTENPIVTKIEANPKDAAIVPYKNRSRVGRYIGTPTYNLSLVTYAHFKLAGFHPRQAVELVKSAWEDNRLNLVRSRYQGEAFLSAMVEVMGRDELSYYSATPERFRALKELASKVQKTKDLLISMNTQSTYKKLFELRDYEPEQIIDWVETLTEAGSKFPIWVLSHLIEESKKDKISLDNLVDRWASADSSCRFDGLDEESDTSDWGH